MKSHQHLRNPTKHKTQPRPLFSCGFFLHCTQSVLSPTNSQSPPLPPPPKLTTHQTSPPESSSSSSSSNSQRFTQWRFQLHPKPDPIHETDSKLKPITLPPKPLPPPIPFTSLRELFHLAEIQLNSGSDSDRLAALYILERSLVPNPPADQACQPELMRGVIANLKNKARAEPATKILLALCLAERNRHLAVHTGSMGAVIEVVAELDDAAGEKALAALELMCTVGEGAAEVRSHALSVPVLVTMMGQMAGRGKEYAISVLAVIYSRGDQVVLAAPPEEVARAVALALRGLLEAGGKEYGRPDSTRNRIEWL